MNAGIKEILDAPIDPSRVKTSPDKFGSWIESHDAIRTANEIFGYAWSSVIDKTECLGTEPYTNADGKQGYIVVYGADVTVTIDGENHSDTGFGSDIGYSGGTLLLHELARKEAVSDAVKRCLRHWGNQFGLSLYDKDAPTNNQTPKQKQDEKEVLAGLQGMSLYPEDPGDFVISFGKHKGSKLSNIPKPYISWLANKFEAKDEYGTAVVENAKKFLGQGEPAPQWTEPENIPF